MEMDLRDRPAVHPAFRIRDQGIHRPGVRPDLLRNIQAADDPVDILHGSMVMMAVAMVMVMVVMVPMRFFMMIMAVVMRVFMAMMMFMPVRVH